MRPAATEVGGKSLLRRIPPGWKLMATFLIIGATVLFPRRPDLLYLIPTMVLLILWPIARMPVVFMLKRLLLAEFFILGMGALTLLAPQSAPVFFAAVIKSNLCVMAMLLLVWTTPFHEILGELRRIHFPPVMLTTLALLYRYLPVLIEESSRMQRARASRTFQKRKAISWESLSTIMGQLFIRSSERAERIYIAMCARGWK